MREGERFTGDWELAAAAAGAGANAAAAATGADANREGASIGPQIGRGDLLGWRLEGRVFIELNPQWTDYNVGLTGFIAGNRLIGFWQYETDAGPTNWGAFEALPE